MGLRGTFEHLVLHIFPSSSQATRRNARWDDQDAFFTRGSGERKSAPAPIPTVRTRASCARASPKFILSPSMSCNTSLPTPTTAISLLDAAAERLDGQYDVNHIYHYLSSVESDLFQQTHITTVCWVS